MKKYRFFFHYFKQKNKMSIHFRKKCTIVDFIDCGVSCETKWKNTQPKLVMQGYATSIEFREMEGSQIKAFIR